MQEESLVSTEKEEDPGHPPCRYAYWDEGLETYVHRNPEWPLPPYRLLVCVVSRARSS
jgi:hypothetical protein